MSATGWVEKHRARDGRVRFRVRGKLHGAVESLGIYDAEDEAGDVLEAWRARHSNDDSAHTLRSWGERWMTLRATDGAHRSARVDLLRWRRHVADDPIADVALARLSVAHVAAWADRLVRRVPVRAVTRGGEVERTARRGERLSRQTVRHVWRLLSVCLRAALERGLLKASPLASMRCPTVIDKPHTRLAFLDVQTIARLRALPVTRELRRAADGSEARSITPAERSAALVAIYTGLRAGELWGLRWSDVRLDDAPELHVRRSRTGPTKSQRDRHVPLLPAAVDELRRWRERRPGIGDALVWPSDGSGDEAQRARVLGGPHGLGYDAGWERVRGLLGVSVRWHDLRHTCASHLVMGTWTSRPLELIEVRDWLGHRAIATTERYAHLRPGGLRDVVSTPPVPHRAPTAHPTSAGSNVRKRERK